MSTSMNPGDRERRLEELSAFADGELETGRVLQACQHWRADGEWRASWHAYHLIGDVLRSDDLASDPARDACFLSQLRLRLADEPVTLAPAREGPRLPARLAAARPQRGWRGSSAAAVAAGFVVVGGVLFTMRAPDGGAPALSREASVASPSLAVASPPPRPTPSDATAGPVAVSVEASSATNPRASVASGKLIRDVRLDRYLAAHKEFAGSSALGVPSGFLRNATAEASDR